MKIIHFCFIYHTHIRHVSVNEVLTKSSHILLHVNYINKQNGICTYCLPLLYTYAVSYVFSKRSRDKS